MGDEYPRPTLWGDSEAEVDGEGRVTIVPLPPVPGPPWLCGRGEAWSPAGTWHKGPHYHGTREEAEACMAAGGETDVR